MSTTTISASDLRNSLADALDSVNADDDGDHGQNQESGQDSEMVFVFLKKHFHKKTLFPGREK